MSTPPDTAPRDTPAGWHPDPAGGLGTAYWEGTRWTGDRRPPRRSFAAAANHGIVGALPGMLCGLFGLLFFMAGAETGGAAYVPVAIVMLAIGGLVSVYFMRGQGPTTEEVKARLTAERKEAKAKRRVANVWGSVAVLERIVRPRASVAAPGADAAAAQVAAVANPSTARALQNLQNLLYTRTITDEEFQAAKDKLVGDPNDSFVQITKLAELHAAGILGDGEFAAAKARALGL